MDALAPVADEGRGRLRKVVGSCLPSFDPRISELENHACYVMQLRPEHIGPGEGTGGIETSQYPEERKAKCASPSSGERKGMSLNLAGAIA